jgi:3-methyladenine DNA glycosylase/8-oxoguanine DNA glycosylase
LGDRAVEAARNSKLPKKVHETIDTARRYAEGTAVRLDVSKTNDIAAIKKLTAIKLER